MEGNYLDLQKFSVYSPESFNLMAVLHSGFGIEIRQQVPSNWKTEKKPKRYRRRKSDIVREYQCECCEKSYGCKTHLTTHRKLKGHGCVGTVTTVRYC